MRGIRWSSATVKKALQLRFACGATGYNLLLKQQFPLPSLRTLQRRMETVLFEPGILNQVFEYLAPSIEYDASSVREIIECAAKIGLHVIAVTSDMGSANRALWRSFGLITGRHCNTVSKVVHPQSPTKWLYFLTDVPHLIRILIKAALVSGKVITLPDDVVKANNLNCSFVSITPVKDLVEFENHHDLKLAPKLTNATISPSHFEKMKVSHALHLFSKSVRSELQYLVKEEGRGNEYLSTAWFLDVFNRWFDFMTSRYPAVALSRLNCEKYEEALIFLTSIINLVQSMKIGDKNDWKPVQAEIIMSTNSVLGIQEELLSMGYKFLLTSRLTQDCLENLFSLVRLKNPIPSPLAFKYALKVICIAQFLKQPHAYQGNYQEDDRDIAIDFLDQPLKLASTELDLKDLEVEISEANCIDDIQKAELNSLYYLVGYCLHSIKKNEEICTGCFVEVTSCDLSDQDSATFTILKEYKQGCLTQVSEKAFSMMLKVEVMLRNFDESVLMTSKNVKRLLLDKAEEITVHDLFLNCHNIKQKLQSKYLTVRLRILCKQMKRKRKQELEKEKNQSQDELGSKSMTTRKLVKKLK